MPDPQKLARLDAACTRLGERIGAAERSRGDAMTPEQKRDKLLGDLRSGKRTRGGFVPGAPPRERTGDDERKRRLLGHYPMTVEGAEKGQRIHGQNGKMYKKLGLGNGPPSDVPRFAKNAEYNRNARINHESASFHHGEVLRHLKSGDTAKAALHHDLAIRHGVEAHREPE